MVDLGTLPGHLRSVASSINDHSIIVGSSRPDVGFSRACLWRDDQIYDLNTLVDLPRGILLMGAPAIDARGTIVTMAHDFPNSSWYTFVLKPQVEDFADLDSNCVVNVDDLLILINAWGQTDSPADINQDDIVNQLDLAILLENWEGAP
jgi:uncharacterized membrane protein